ncbi:MAG: phosphate ABC transporter permease PstA [Chloroflexi bacterium]|nr:phosphate ABC transporter permease PstA [Chloroflexota bacterium]
MRLGRDAIQRMAQAVIWMAAVSTILILMLILFHILKEGLPIISLEFLSGAPHNMGRSGGIFPTIVGTIALTIVAIVVATPLGVGAAIYLVEYTKEGRITRIIRFGAECLAGIPSIIYGLFGFVFFVLYLGLGWSILSGGLTLAVMILPTIIRTTEEALRAVPLAYREVSYTLGGTQWQTITRVVLPAALPGIATGVILGIGRSVGETAAVILTAGSSLRIPTTIFSPARTMAVHFYVLAREAISVENAYGTAAVLIIAVLAINVAANWLVRRMAAGK